MNLLANERAEAVLATPTPALTTTIIGGSNMALMDITGQRFGRLVVLRREPTQQRWVDWRCRCDCGQETVVRSAHLRYGRTLSCGCYKMERISETHFVHGQSQPHGGGPTRLYSIWVSMRKRCNCKTDAAYNRYGGRGIAVCAEWDSFPEFERWAIDAGYQRNLSIDRINNDEGYSPANCRWADQKTQNRNTSTNRMLTYRNKTSCITEHAENAGIGRTTVEHRLRVGWSVEKALGTPVAKRARR